jgi:hypothetical protein
MKKTFAMALVAATVAMNATASDKGLYFKAMLEQHSQQNSILWIMEKRKLIPAQCLELVLVRSWGHGFSADLSFYRFDKFKFSHTLADAGNGKVTQDISSNLLTLNANYALPKYKSVKSRL